MQLADAAAVVLAAAARLRRPGAFPGGAVAVGARSGFGQPCSIRLDTGAHDLGGDGRCPDASVP